MASITRADPSATPLPSGILTFLVTDIEGSTRMWQAAPEAMRAALARHDVILRQGIETHGGHVFKTAGDAFFAAFTTPWHALEAALAMQQALQAEAWPPQSPIRVRMALHSGAAELRDDDYFGQPLNQVVRLLSAGHGGQTLVSSTTCELCNDRLPAGAVLKSLGEHLLKDLARRQTIYQLGHPSLPQAFAPLQTLLAPLDTRAPSIAVLPFVNRSRDEEDEYFSDGLADELLNVLAKIRGLRVAARTSAFSFKGKQTTIADVGRTLNVATVLEGSVRKARQPDAHLGAARERCRRVSPMVGDLRPDAGGHLCGAGRHRAVGRAELRTKLLGEAADAKVARTLTAQVAAAVKGRASDPEAYRLYLQARHFTDRFTRDDTAKGIGYLKQALDLDPVFALAWAELGRAYANEAGNTWAPVSEGYARGREAVARALALEPDLAEGHAQMGWIQMTHDRDWRGAEASYSRALKMAPGNAGVLRRASALAANLGRIDEAIALGCQAVEQDPLSAPAYSNLGVVLNMSGRLGEAETALRKALELAPARAVTRGLLSLVLLAQGRGEEALADALREPEEWCRLWALAIIHHAASRPDESEMAVQELLAQHSVDAAYQVATVYAARCETDLAYAWLERAYAQRDAGLSDMKIGAVAPLAAGRSAMGSLSGQDGAGGLSR